MTKRLLNGFSEAPGRIAEHWRLLSDRADKVAKAVMQYAFEQVEDRKTRTNTIGKRTRRLIDCQVYTEHLERFGATPWPRDVFLDALAEALEEETRRGPWRFDTEETP